VATAASSALKPRTPIRIVNTTHEDFILTILDLPAAIETIETRPGAGGAKTSTHAAGEEVVVVVTEGTTVTLVPPGGPEPFGVEFLMSSPEAAALDLPNPFLWEYLDGAVEGKGRVVSLESLMNEESKEGYELRGETLTIVPVPLDPGGAVTR
jgi:hypothetical protein